MRAMMIVDAETPFNAGLNFQIASVLLHRFA